MLARPGPEEAWKCTATTFINILCNFLFILKPCMICAPINNLIYIIKINNCENPLEKSEGICYCSGHGMLSNQAFSQDIKVGVQNVH